MFSYDRQVTIFIPGIPAGKPRHRHGKHGGYLPRLVKGKPVYTAWWNWHDAMMSFLIRNGPLFEYVLTEAVAVDINFCMPRPKTHLRKDGSPRKGAPEHHIVKPDRDNLDKGVLDCLVKAGVLKDDTIVISGTIEKFYQQKYKGIILGYANWSQTGAEIAIAPCKGLSLP